MKKRLYFILSGENLFHPYYFQQTYNKLDKNKFEVAGVSIPEEKYKKGFIGFLKKQLDLWGIEGFLFISITSTVFKLLDYLKIKDNLSIKNISGRYMIPVIEVKNVNNEEHLLYLKKLKIDIIISSNGQIFKNKLLETAKIACINRHTALLPKYGGCMPVFWAMFNDEKEFGVSVHYMVKEIDKGNILYQEHFPLIKNNSLFYNYILAFDKSINITIIALDNVLIRKTVAKFYPNNKQYFSNPKREDIKKFKEKTNSFNLSDIIFYFQSFNKLFQK